MNEIRPIYEIGRVPGPMPFKFMELAKYNRAVQEGAIYDPRYCLKMVKLQAEYNEWEARFYPERVTASA